MLTEPGLEKILTGISQLKIGVLGDLFLDRYLDLDDKLTEPSLETGLPAYQVVKVRPSPGAAGTIINNLAALGVGRIVPLAMIGNDGEGFELRQALREMKAVDLGMIFSWPGRKTPTYTKPMLHQPGQQTRELNRLDIKNRTPLPFEAEVRILDFLNKVWQEVDALIVLDQVSEPECGVVTTGIRQRLAELGDQSPEKLILADSRERIHLFRSVWTKPNQVGCLRAEEEAKGSESRKAGSSKDVSREAVQFLAGQTGCPVLCTCGDKGILIADPRAGRAEPFRVPAYPVNGPIDIVGAGDSATAGIACALATGSSLSEAAAFGNLIASITIQQIGTTGTASPSQVRQRWREII